MSGALAALPRAVALGALAAVSLAGFAQEEDAAPADPAQDEASVGAAAAEPAAPEDQTPELSARERYNLGLTHLQAGDAVAAAEAFLAARDGAGPDPELRYRAAFNLGLALAAQAPAAGEDAAKPEDAIETLRRSAAWFSDAVRLAPPDDDDARINLELVARRILALADQLNDGNRLEARLDRLIDDQRGVRDGVRRLLAEVHAQQAGAEPLGFKGEYEALASRERMLLAEVGDCIDLAAEERLAIEQAPPEQRTPEQQGRVHRLTGLTDYLERARQSLDDARRRLRRLEGERGHRRADGALAELKRAREQLFDPLTVLRAVARDEVELMGHTAALAGGGLRLDDAPPAWLTDKHLAERQEDIGVRTGGVLGQFEAVAAAEAAPQGGGEPPAQARMRRAATAAAPILDAGLAAMRDAIASLESAQPAAALDDQRRALVALRRTIEEFADVKGLIELAYAGQQGVDALLTPPDDDAATAVDAMDAGERAMAIAGAAAENQRRMARLETLLAEQQAEEAAQAEAPQDGVAQPGQTDDAQTEQARQAAEERYQLAEALRGQAAAGLDALLAAVDEAAGLDPPAARAASADTLRALEELRRLFFSIVEHLRELRAEQENTHDGTATAQFEAADLADGIQAALGPLAQRQAGHAGLGDALAQALAEQADAANAAGISGAAGAAQPADDAAQAGERLAEAAAEVRKAGGRMHSAAALLDDAVARAGAMSPELEPALEDQRAALDHLENALRALAPPDEQRQDQRGDDQRQQQAQQPQPSPEDEQMSQRQALKRLQAIRDREAERQRRRSGETATAEPVEKDW